MAKPTLTSVGGTIQYADGKVIITLPRCDRKSASGKSLLLATTGGNVVVADDASATWELGVNFYALPKVTITEAVPPPAPRAAVTSCVPVSAPPPALKAI